MITVFGAIKKCVRFMERLIGVSFNISLGCQRFEVDFTVDFYAHKLCVELQGNMRTEALPKARGIMSKSYPNA